MLEKNKRCMPIIGSQSIGDPPTSIKIGSPITEPPKPRPVLTKPIQVNIKAIIVISRGVKIKSFLTQLS
jgi:hypothetical protein